MVSNMIMWKLMIPIRQNNLLKMFWWDQIVIWSLMLLINIATEVQDLIQMYILWGILTEMEPTFLLTRGLLYQLIKRVYLKDLLPMEQTLDSIDCICGLEIRI